MDYNQREADTVQAVLDAFVDSDIEFVIPRGYQKLPDAVPGGDIDIYVAPDDYDDAVHISKKHGFSSRVVANMAGLKRKIEAEPIKAITLPFADPKRAVDVLATHTIRSSDSSLSRGYSEWEAYNGDVKVHLMNHLAYPSPMNDQLIRVDPAVERSLFENRRFVDGLPVPSRPDELAHLVCRGIFSYDGTFPTYYVERCDELAQYVFSSTDQTARLEELLSPLFFEADSVVLENIKKSNYDTIRDDLLQYSCY